MSYGMVTQISHYACTKKNIIYSLRSLIIESTTKKRFLRKHVNVSLLSGVACKKIRLGVNYSHSSSQGNHTPLRVQSMVLLFFIKNVEFKAAFAALTWTGEFREHVIEQSPFIALSFEHEKPLICSLTTNLHENDSHLFI